MYYKLSQCSIFQISIWKLKGDMKFERLIPYFQGRLGWQSPRIQGLGFNTLLYETISQQKLGYHIWPCLAQIRRSGNQIAIY